MAENSEEMTAEERERALARQYGYLPEEEETTESSETDSRDPDGNGLTEAEEQNIAAALARNNDRIRREQQGVEAGDDAVAEQAREFEREVTSTGGQLSFVERQARAEFGDDVDSVSIRGTGSNGQFRARITTDDGRTVTRTYRAPTDESEVAVRRDGNRLSVELTQEGRENIGANKTDDEIRRDVARQRDDLSADELEVSRGQDGSVSIGLSDEAVRERAVQQIESRLERRLANEEAARLGLPNGELRDALAENVDLQEGEDFVVEEQNGRFVTRFTDEFRQQRAEAAIERQLEDQSGLDLTVGEDFNVEQRNGRFVATDVDVAGARVDDAPRGARRAVERSREIDVASKEYIVAAQVASQYGGLAAEDFDVETETQLAKDAGGNLALEKSYSLSLNEQGQEKLQEAREQREEQFGDDGGRVLGIEGGEAFLDGISRGVQEFADDAGEELAERSAIAYVERETIGTNYSGRLTEGLVSGGIKIFDAAGAVRGLDEAGETIGYVASESAQGRGGEAVDDLGTATGQAVDAGIQYATRNPFKFAGEVVGSAALSYGAIAGASRVSGTAGRAAAYGIQPGEEVVTTGLSRAFPKTAQRLGGTIDFEEAAVVGARKGVDLVGDLKTRVPRSLPDRPTLGRPSSPLTIDVKTDSDAGLVRFTPELKRDALQTAVDVQTVKLDAQMAIGRTRARGLGRESGTGSPASTGEVDVDLVGGIREGASRAGARGLRTKADAELAMGRGIRAAEAASADVKADIDETALRAGAGALRTRADAELALESTITRGRSTARTGVARTGARGLQTKADIDLAVSRTPARIGAGALRRKADADLVLDGVPGQARNRALPPVLRSQQNINDAAFRAGYRFGDRTSLSDRLVDARADLGIDRAIARGEFGDAVGSRFVGVDLEQRRLRRRLSEVQADLGIDLAIARGRARRSIQDKRSDLAIDFALARGDLEQSIKEFRADVGLTASRARGEVAAVPDRLQTKKTDVEEGIESGVKRGLFAAQTAKLELDRARDLTITVGRRSSGGNSVSTRTVDADDLELDIDDLNEDVPTVDVEDGREIGGSSGGGSRVDARSFNEIQTPGGRVVQRVGPSPSAEVSTRRQPVDAIQERTRAPVPKVETVSGQLDQSDRDAVTRTLAEDATSQRSISTEATASEFAEVESGSRVQRDTLVESYTEARPRTRIDQPLETQIETGVAQATEFEQSFETVLEAEVESEAESRRRPDIPRLDDPFDDDISSFGPDFDQFSRDIENPVTAPDQLDDRTADLLGETRRQRRKKRRSSAFDAVDVDLEGL